ncbi:MAG: hypothetical protein ACREO7_08820 [Pseudoxanthomonas sp.]
MKSALLPLLLVLATGPALATESATSTSGDTEATTARALDLSLPKQVADTYKVTTPAADPPGTYYGDHSGPIASSDSVERVDTCDGELHGSVSMGVGYSKRGGNSNWQGTNLNSCKRYYNDDGKERQIGVSISIGQGSGPDFVPLDRGWRGGSPRPR